MRAVPPKIVALMSAALVVLSGNVAFGVEIMSSRKQSNSNPRVFTSKAGRRYARTVDVICSPSARAEISRQAQLSSRSKNDGKSNKDTTRNK